VLAQGARHLEGEPQPTLSVAVDLTAGDPTIDSPRILDAADIRGQFPPDNLNQFLNNL
jgi:hypothetical protein